jgi:hypothetical protein
MRTISLVVFLTCCLVSGTFSTNARALDFKDVPLPEDVKIQVSLDKNAPYVLTGFTKQSPEQVLSDIVVQLGAPTKQSTRFGRTTYYFEVGLGTAKVTMTAQKNMYQLDIMIF